MTRRAGGWILGLAVLLAMAGGAWFALRGAFNRETVAVAFVQGPGGTGPTSKAILRGAAFALQEAAGRAGRFRVILSNEAAYDRPESVPVAAWFGTSEALLYQGHQESPPFYVSVFDTYPLEPEGSYRIIPGFERQGNSAARWAKRSGGSRAVLLSDATLQCRAIGASFQKTAAALGLAVEGPFDATLDELDRVLASKADVVFYSGEEAPYSTTTKLFTALRGKGYAGRMITGEADPDVSFLATRPGLLDGTYLVSPFAPAPADLAARMGITPGPHVTAGYFAMKAALESIDRANSLDAASLRRAAAALPYFDDKGRAALRPCALYLARNGVFEFVELLE